MLCICRFHDIRLVILGSTRNTEDEALVESLKKSANELTISDNVDFVVNGSYADLTNWLSIAQVGIHTMWNEHFGISIVEMMAAGLIVVAHKSGGPLMDIIIPEEGELVPPLNDSDVSQRDGCNDDDDNKSVKVDVDDIENELTQDMSEISSVLVGKEEVVDTNVDITDNLSPIVSSNDNVKTSTGNG